MQNPQDYDRDDPALSSAGRPSLDVPAPPCLSGILTEKCATLACHSADGPADGLDLTGSGSALSKKLIDVVADHQLAVPKTGCIANQKLIDSADPKASWLVQKLTTDGQTCGLAMPVGIRLDAAEVACFSMYADSVAAAKSAAASGGP